MPTAISSIFTRSKNIVDSLKKKLDQTAMYRTVTLALSFLVVITLIFGALGKIPVSFGSQIISLFVVLSVGLCTNILAARLFHVRANHESAIITSLIVFFLVFPAYTLFDHHVIALVIIIAILSKYVIAIRRQHIFNAAAFGAAAVSVTGYAGFTWWIGMPELLIPLLIAGSIVVAKVRKWTPVLAFLSVAFVVFMFESWRFGANLEVDARIFFTSYPALFLAFFMLTEPFTMPPTKRLQILYGAFVGFLSSTTIITPLSILFFGLFSIEHAIIMTPELALVIGNLAFYGTTLRRKLYLKLLSTRELAHMTYEFVFVKPAGLRFRAGQYLEWTLPHTAFDSRGIRRYLTIASSPREDDVRIGVKMAEPSSTFKSTLSQLVPGDVIIASQLAGDFTLPHDPAVKLGLIAGGIGITPFRSFIGEMEATGVSRDAVHFCCTMTVAEIPYREEFKKAEVFGVKNVYVIAKEEVSSPYERGFITKEMLEKHAPDYLERVWYLSGPPGMVNAYNKLLREAGVSRRRIVKDFFPGLA